MPPLTITITITIHPEHSPSPPLALSLKKRTSQIDGWLVAKDATDSAVASTEGLGSASSLAELKAAIKTIEKVVSLACKHEAWYLKGVTATSGEEAATSEGRVLSKRVR